MQAVVLIGIQATGKSSFCRERFGETHVRISLDMLKTRHREARILEVCCDTQQPFVIDNTNPTKEDRSRYIVPARKAGMRVIGYYFASSIGGALARNAEREGKARIPDGGVHATHARLELPAMDEGFDELHYVQIRDGKLEVEAWREERP